MRENVETLVRERLVSKSVDDEVMEYVQDLLLDLVFEEEEREVASISENIADFGGVHDGRGGGGYGGDGAESEWWWRHG